jgi:hypothetical protein
MTTVLLLNWRVAQERRTISPLGMAFGLVFNQTKPNQSNPDRIW